MSPQGTTMNSESPTRWGLLYIKGMLMGAADLVPGVSGGTIAFITGIYDELIETIAGVRLNLVGQLRDVGLRVTWREANLNFLMVLVAGIFTSAFSLAGVLSWLTENRPVELWAFFFGLVAASIPLVGSQIRHRKLNVGVLIIIGATLAAFVTSLPPFLQSDAPVFLFACGAIAICAMILPGISGSFILLILGAYAPVLRAIEQFDLLRIITFGSGALLGILSFSRGLKWLLIKQRDPTLALLVGFLIGSLNALWPWKSLVRELYTHHDGRTEWLKANTWPNDPSEIWPVLGFTIVGVLIVTGLGRIKSRNREA